MQMRSGPLIRMDRSTLPVGRSTAFSQVRRDGPNGPLKTEANPYICVNTRDIYKIISPSFLYTRVRNMYGPYGPYGPQPLEQGNLMVHSGIRRMDRMDWTRAERNTEMETRR